MRDFLRAPFKAQKPASSFHVMNHPAYPIGVPLKFDPNGNVQRFPGNTIISHLSLSDPLYSSLLELHAKLSDCALSHLFTLLPPESWHMTVFEGVCDRVRHPGHWPLTVPRDAPLEECTTLFATRLKEFELGEDGKPPYRLTAVGFSSFGVGIGVKLRLRTPEEEARFRGLRNRLADTLQIRHAHHDHYELHLSLAYFLRHLDENQKKELAELLWKHFEGMPKDFELGAPEFCVFENMFKFERQFYLGQE
ncbi:hypothetical protein OQA88_1675 [Cercophora sp. LCS_1]